MKTVALKRGQVGKTKGIDITVKSAKDWAVAFAPTWEMVSEYKTGIIDNVEYEKLYTKILVDANEEVFQKLWEVGINNGGKISILCYCPSGKFCHTHLLIDFAIKHYPQWFTDGRPQILKRGNVMNYLLALDLETTGLKPSYHEITQIATILLDKSLDELGSFETLVRIDHHERGLENNFNVFEYTGIKLEDLKKAPTLKEALRALETFVRSKTGDFDLRKIVIFGQNPAFDKGFLEAAFEQQGWKFPFDFHTLALESMYVHNHLLKTGELPKEITLGDICKVANVKNKQKHNAMSDIRATVDALHKLCIKKKVKASDSELENIPVKPTPRRRNVKSK